MGGVNKNRIAVIGSSGHAQMAIDAIERQGKFEIAGLLDSLRSVGEEICGYRVLGNVEDLPEIAARQNIAGCFIAVGDNWIRYMIAEKIRAVIPGFRFVSAIHPSVQVARDVTIGEGSILMAGAVVDSASQVGDFCILNSRSSLSHESSMDKFSSLGPAATTGGNVHIGAFTAVCLGASVIHGMSVGKQTVIGAGALVVKDIPEYCVAFGVPARVIRKRKKGDRYL